ncbi:MAG: YkgJ family cysteine cluster protein [Eubacterium sp.]|nr:YkgJ family cysteine cluster protein [Eubacterium sp.]
MLRYEDINQISDGKIYAADDMVPAGTNGCAGCSRCCESDMGNTIVLTPYDMYELTKATDKTFDELLTEFKIELSMMDGIILPNLKMDEGCGFLKDGRCTIHAHRPGICRLFPLGRIYYDSLKDPSKDKKDGFGYFLQTGECPVPDKSDVKVSDWLGIENLDRNTAFINKWHNFLKFEKRKVGEVRSRAENEIKRLSTISETDLEVYAGIIGEKEIYDEKGFKAYKKEKQDQQKETSDEKVKGIIKTVIAYFYLDKYDIESDFYQQFDERMKKCLAALRK